MNSIAHSTQISELFLVALNAPSHLLSKALDSAAFCSILFLSTSLSALKQKGESPNLWDTFVLLCGLNKMYFKYCKIAYWVCLDCWSLTGNNITQKVVKEVHVFTVLSIRKY